MRTYITKFDYTDLITGETVRESFIAKVTQEHPELVDYELVNVQRFSTRFNPDRTIAQFRAKANPMSEIRFIFNRSALKRVIPGEPFTEEQATVLTAIQDDGVVLLEKIGEFLLDNYPILRGINKEEFVTHSEVLYTGGTIKPNYLLTPKPDSILYYELIIIRLAGDAVLIEEEIEDIEQWIYPDTETEVFG